MTPREIEELYDKYVLGNYSKAPLTLIRGSGCRVWDNQGKDYLDFTAGIAVNSIGHCHSYWVQEVRRQARTLVHTSNLFRNEPQGRLAATLARKMRGGKVFVCNSGLEANEALLKLARRHGVEKAGGVEGKCYKVIGARHGFHGRSFGGMSATDSEKIRKGFAPFIPGFSLGELNNLDSFARLIDDETAAILVEPIQGEGGIHCCTDEFLRGLRELCDQHNLLLLLDEVQCGIGRTGTFFAHESAGIHPDAMALAKGLGGGFPIGAMWVSEQRAGLLPPGSHGTTFGGNPLACAAALATLTVIDREHLVQKVQNNGAHWMRYFNGLADQFGDSIEAVRGRGYMIGIQLKMDPAPAIAEMRSLGLLVAGASGNVIRLLPPLIATPADLEKAIRILRGALSNVAR